MNCPYCDVIARERVAYQCVLDEITRLTGITYLFLRQAAVLDRFTLLECSPRRNENRRQIYEATLRQYRASDYDFQAHRADLKVNLAVRRRAPLGPGEGGSCRETAFMSSTLSASPTTTA